MPDLEIGVWQRYRDLGVVVVGVNASAAHGVPDSPAVLQTFIDQGGLTYPVGFDANDSYGEFLPSGISAFPLDIVIDGGGAVRYLSWQYDQGALSAVIEEILDNGPLGDDDDAGPDDDDAGPDDDDAGPDDDDAGPDDDDDDVPFAACPDGQETCDAPGGCIYELGCSCVNSPVGPFCIPNCNTTDDCPIDAGSGFQMNCNGGICTP